jgi:hypothetical protein
VHPDSPQNFASFGAPQPPKRCCTPLGAHTRIRPRHPASASGCSSRLRHRSALKFCEEATNPHPRLPSNFRRVRSSPRRGEKSAPGLPPRRRGRPEVRLSTWARAKGPKTKFFGHQRVRNALTFPKTFDFPDSAKNRGRYGRFSEGYAGNRPRHPKPSQRFRPALPAAASPGAEILGGGHNPCIPTPLKISPRSEHPSPQSGAAPPSAPEAKIA